MSERIEHLDLLADSIMANMETLCGAAVRENLSTSDVLETCGIPRPLYPDADDPLDLKRHRLASGLLDDVFKHMASRWSQFRVIDKRMNSVATPSYDDEGEFD